MKTILKIKYVVLAAIAILAFSCSTEEGETGPMGPQGEQGIAGQDGNANIIASEWIASQHNTSPSNSSSFMVEDVRLSEGVLTSALIMAYGNTVSSGIYPLPDNFRNIVYTFSLAPGSISFQAFAPDNPPVLFNLFSSYRYIIIPSNTLTGKSTKKEIKEELKAEGVDITDYYQVADYYGLDY